MWKLGRQGKDSNQSNGKTPAGETQQEAVSPDTYAERSVRLSDKPKRILVADDDHDILSMLQNALKFRGYEVIQAENGDQAWELILKELPDAAILDVDMPYLSGLQVCRNLRAESRTRHIGVIFLTGHQEVADKVLAFEVGADDYITKPFLPRELTARLAALLKRLDVGSNGHDDLESDLAPGQVIGVLGAKGGVGTSAMAVNLAVALGIQGNSVSLVDLALEHSIDTMLMDLSPNRRGTITELSKQYGREADWTSIQSYMLAHQSGVWLLPGPVNPAQADLVTGEHARHYIDTLRSRHRYVVVDLPSSFRDTSLDVLELCDMLLLVVTPDLPALKCLKGVSEVLQQFLRGRALQVVINDVTGTAQLSTDDIKESTKLSIIATIPHGGAQFHESVNMGTPMVQRRPQSGTSQAIKKLAQTIVAPATVKEGLRVVGV